MELLKEFFSNPAIFFDAMNTDQSHIALILCGLLYLLGLWTGWLIWGRMARRRLKAMRQLESKFNKLDAEHKVMVGKYEQLSTEHETLNKYKEEVEARLENAERESRAFKQQVLQLKDENVTYQTDVETYLRKIDVMDTQVRNLTTHNTQLQDELEVANNSMNSLATVQSAFNSTRDRLTIVESRISDLVGQNQNLRVELSKIKDTAPATAGALPLVSPTTDTKSEEDKEEEVIIQAEKTTEKVSNSAIEARQAIQNAMGSKIKMASLDEKDDLQKIDGIGTFLEKQLNELGFYTYEQLCQWDKETIGWVTQAMEYIPGRIEKDDWKGQACKLTGTTDKMHIQTPDENIPLTVPVPLFNKKSTTKKETDLKVVEGIGQKIESLLKDAGINTWKELADTKVEYLKEVLSTAGGRFRLAVPDTWPKQAKMAADGQWNELDKYQDYLDGGKEPKK